MGRRGGTPVGKVTVSLPRSAIAYADQRARKDGSSRSRVIADALERARATDEETLAAEGYRFYAAEASAFAESSHTAVAEAVADAG